MSDLFSKTELEIKEELFTEIKKNIPQITDFNSGGILRGFIEIIARWIYMIYVMLNLAFKRAFITDSEGDWLDLKVAEVGLERQKERKAEGFVIFGREEAVLENVKIEAGTIVKTPLNYKGNDFKYLVKEEIILPSGQTEILVPVIADLAGKDYNVAADQINMFVNPVDGIDYAKNEANWVSVVGLDRESDESLKERYFLKWQSISGANRYAYESWAKDIEGVNQVLILPLHRGTGTVDIIITSHAGVPSPELLAEVKAYIEDKKPITSNIDVISPFVIDTNITANLILYPDAINPDEIVLEFRNKVDEFFGNISIGQDLVINQIEALAVGIEGVKDVILTNFNTQVPDTSILNNLSTTITYEIATEY